MADSSTATSGQNDLPSHSSSFHPPPAMRIEGANIEDGWKSWSQKFELFILASRSENLSDRVKVAMFLSAIGDEGLQIYNTFVFDQENDRNDYKIVKEKFTEYCSPHKNVVYERYNFWKTNQNFGETIDSFVTTLRIRAKSCEFEHQCDSMIRDRIVLGCNDPRLQERLLREPELTLSKAINLCRAAETTKEQIKTIKTGSHESENVSEFKTFKSSKRSENKGEKTFLCRKCGKNHAPKNCSAYGKTCSYCLNKNHFSNFCYKKQNDSTSTRSNSNYNRPSRNETQYQSRDRRIRRTSFSRDSQTPRARSSSLSRQINTVQSDLEQQLYMGSINSDKITDSNTWYSELSIANSTVLCKLDTGAQGNTISKKTYEGLKIKPILCNTNVILTSFGNTSVKPLGVIQTTIWNKYKDYDVQFYVMNFDCETLIGLPTCIQMDLIRLVDSVRPTVTSLHRRETNEILDEFQDIFKGLGCIPGAISHNVPTLT